MYCQYCQRALLLHQRSIFAYKYRSGLLFVAGLFAISCIQTDVSCIQIRPITPHPTQLAGFYLPTGRAPIPFLALLSLLFILQARHRCLSCRSFLLLAHFLAFLSCHYKRAWLLFLDILLISAIVTPHVSIAELSFLFALSIVTPHVSIA